MLDSLAHIRNPRLRSTLLLGFSSSLPLALTSSTLQAWFTQAGVNLVTIGALTLIGLPYLLKFLWAPVMDRFIPPFLGRRRGWIAIMQLSLCAALLILANMNPLLHAARMGQLALLIAFFSASQDIAIDAYRADILLPNERGIGVAYLIVGLRVAVLLSGALALIIADHIGWRTTYHLMAILMGTMVLATIFSPECVNVVPPKSFVAAVIDPFKDLLRRDLIVVLLLFIVFYKIGDALALSLMSTFLLRHLGFSLTDIGIAYKTMGLVATLLGAFVGGIWMNRIGMYRALLWFGILQAVSNLMFVWLAWVGKDYFLMMSSIFIENFCSGLSTAALIAFLMSLCHARYSATQYAVFSALFSLGRVLIGPLSAVMVLHWGWVNFFLCSFLLSFPGVILLTFLRRRVSFNVEAVEC
ncbi:hypothetical protein AYO45_06240 [Gammaproteobacteria bacterium SCGC AG-212-F23]|nr:hypothetical protein AYO45_06240 [Gammaproteobacteria bacterium SCGC AG-212-F23]